MKALQGSLALCRNLHIFRDILNDIYLPLVSLFQGSRNIEGFCKTKGSMFWNDFKERMLGYYRKIPFEMISLV